jgi:hypothetical protein
VAVAVALLTAFLIAAAASSSVADGVTFSIYVGVGFFASLFRLPILVLEMIVQTAARYWNAITGRKCLKWVPVLYHELSYLPHPFLEGHLLAEADADPLLTRRVLDACSITRGQTRTGRKV